jgi:hypothetical protein
VTKRSALRGGLLLMLTLGFGLGFGLNYGNSTQTSYILRSLKILHPTLWTRDWLINQTVGYHPAYAWLGALLLRVDPSGASVAWANVIFVALGMLAIYWAVILLTSERRALAAFCVVLILASVTRTSGPGLSYAFCELFLPSTLGTVGILAAAAAFVAKRPLVSGLCLAFAGIFHVNCLVLGLCVFGLAWPLSEPKRLARNLLCGVAPAALALLYFLPFLLATAHPGVSQEAQRIFQVVRSPHHYIVPKFAWDFALWAGFQLLGVASLLGPAKRGSSVHRRLLLLLSSWWALVVPAVLLSSVIPVPFVRQLFAWRICPEAELLAQAAFAAALVDLFCDGQRAWSNIDRRTRALGGVSLVAMLVGSATTGRWVPTLVVLCLLLAAFVICNGYARVLFAPGQTGLPISRVLGALLFTLACVNVARFSRLRHNSNLLSGGDRSVAELCDWAIAHSPEDALFLTPPNEDDLRLRCQRAVVVDWKTVPAEPDEVLAWMRRIEDETGRRPFRTDADLAGYEELDATRVAELRARYGIDYVVVERGHEPSLGIAPVFSGSRFVVYPLANNEGVR